MIRIAITTAAFEATAAAIPLGSVAVEREGRAGQATGRFGGGGWRI